MSDATKQTRGKWAQKGVPHKGWRWVGYEDLRDIRRICEMCEFSEIRHVHYAAHDDYPERLTVGCDCVEQMTEDYIGPRQHEKDMRNVATRRENFPKRKQWRPTGKGNTRIDLDGYRVVISARESRWYFSYLPPKNRKFVYNKQSYSSEREAKLGAFDRVMMSKGDGF